MGYPKTSFLSLLVQGYPWISRMWSYPWILQYKSGFGRVSFFQMLYGMARYDVGCSITSYYELLALFHPACPVQCVQPDLEASQAWIRLVAPSTCMQESRRSVFGNLTTTVTRTLLCPCWTSAPVVFVQPTAHC